MFGKFTGCKDLQEIRIYLYGISKVNSSFNGATTCRKFFYWFNSVFYKINKLNKEYPVTISFQKTIASFLISNQILGKNENFRKTNAYI